MSSQNNELRRSTDVQPVAETPQARFNAAYITAAEIYRSHKVSRPTLMSARRRGLLPDGIHVGESGFGMYIWERTPELMRALDAWRLILEVRRKGAPAA